MSLAEILWLAVGVAMDAAAVAASRGLLLEQVRRRLLLTVAVYFGGAQVLMQLLGWWLGVWAGPLVHAWARWIAFGVIASLGAKLLWDARRPAAVGGTSVSEPLRDPVGPETLLALSLATSIDAFAVGATLPILNAPLALSVVSMGLVTAVLSAAGLLVGRRFGALLGSRLDIIGGLALIALAFKLLFDHQ